MSFKGIGNRNRRNAQDKLVRFKRFWHDDKCTMSSFFRQCIKHNMIYLIQQCWTHRSAHQIFLLLISLAFNCKKNCHLQRYIRKETRDHSHLMFTSFPLITTFAQPMDLFRNSLNYIAINAVTWQITSNLSVMSRCCEPVQYTAYTL